MLSLTVRLILRQKWNRLFKAHMLIILICDARLYLSLAPIVIRLLDFCILAVAIVDCVVFVTILTREHIDLDWGLALVVDHEMQLLIGEVFWERVRFLLLLGLVEIDVHCDHHL